MARELAIPREEYVRMATRQNLWRAATTADASACVRSKLIAPQ